jgi:hypothetical protein
MRWPSSRTGNPVCLPSNMRINLGSDCFLLACRVSTMARTLAVAVVLLAGLPGPFVQAGAPNTCSEMPYALLENYQPAKQWCSSHNQAPTGTMVTATPPPCTRGDALCSIFADLRGAASTFASDLWYVLYCRLC